MAAGGPAVGAGPAGAAAAVAACDAAGAVCPEGAAAVPVGTPYDMTALGGTRVCVAGRGTTVSEIMGFGDEAMRTGPLVVNDTDAGAARTAAEEAGAGGVKDVQLDIWLSPRTAEDLRRTEATLVVDESNRAELALTSTVSKRAPSPLLLEPPLPGTLLPSGSEALPGEVTKTPIDDKEELLPHMLPP